MNRHIDQTVWIVGYVHGPGPLGESVEWSIKGVFDTEEKAIAACTTYRHFCAPKVLNNRSSDESKRWYGGYFPKILSN